MMWKTDRYAYASALPAIAAALALSSTPAWSQEVTSPTTEPQPISIAPSAPADTASSATDTTIVSDPAPVVDPTTETTAAAPAKPKAKSAVTKAARTVAGKKPTTTRVASTAPAIPAEPASAAAPAAAQPIVEARPIETAQLGPESQVSKTALQVDETAIMLGGGALALLALGGAGVLLARRRRDEDEEVMEETISDEPMTVEPQPMPRHDLSYEDQAAIVAPSAFAWGNARPAEQTVVSDRHQGETWVERAYRGPTPDNPSLSLRKRLKRANFFDARASRVAAGKAETVDADAGLPDSHARELELA